MLFSEVLSKIYQDISNYNQFDKYILLLVDTLLNLITVLYKYYSVYQHNEDDEEEDYIMYNNNNIFRSIIKSSLYIIDSLIKISPQTIITYFIAQHNRYNPYDTFKKYMILEGRKGEYNITNVIFTVFKTIIFNLQV